MNYLRQHSTRSTPQSEPMRSDQTENAAGGYTWELDSFGRLRRFLILGAEGGTFYVGERDLVGQNIKALQECLALDGQRTIDLLVEVSDRGLAKDNDVALFSLAVATAAPDLDTRRMAWAALPAIARTGTHLLHFVAFRQQFGGVGSRAAKRGLAAWYTDKSPDRLAYQLIKYRQRDRWSHRDVLRLIHPEAPTAAHAQLFEFVTGNPSRTRPSLSDVEDQGSRRLIEGFRMAQVAESPRNTANLVREYGLPREALLSEHLGTAEVQEALLEKMPMTALIRNLANLTRSGVLKPLSAAEELVVAQLGDVQRLRRARVHPITVLSALRVYAKGVPIRGRGEPWEPVPAVVEALDGAFYAAFETVKPAGKRTMLAFDISGSMTFDEIAGVPGLNPREGSAAMGMVTVASEPRTYTLAFAGPYVEDSTGWGRATSNQAEGMEPFTMTKGSRLDDVVARMKTMPFGRTDCALPMRHATEKGLEVDTFVIYTDNETWAGTVHPQQALENYRRKSGIQARLIVAGMTATGSTIGDPKDPGVLDVVGFDSSAPATIAAFSRGEV